MDNETDRPPFSEEDSRLDREQKSAGEYYYAVAERTSARIDRRRMLDS